MYTVSRDELLTGLVGHDAHALHKTVSISLAEHCDGAVNTIYVEVDVRVNQLVQDAGKR